MKHNHLDMLPIRAFKPRSGSRFTSFGGGGMTLEGGGGFIEDIVESVAAPFEAVGEAVSDVAQTISDVGVQIDEGVNKAVPGGWVTVGAVVATVATMGATSELLVAELGAEGAALGAEVAVDAAMAAEAAGAMEAGIEMAAIGAEAAAEAGTALAVAEGASTSIALEAGAAAAEIVGPGVELIGGYEAAAAAAQQLALQEAATTVGMGALKGAGMNALSSVVQGREITPEGLMLAAATGGAGAGLGSLASSAAADYGTLASKAAGAMGGSLGGALTGAALSGKDLGEAALTGGISGLTGVAGLGANAGLQELGVDATGAKILANTALGAGTAAWKGGDALTGAFNSALGTGIGMGTGAVGQGLVNAGKDVYSSGTDYLKSLVADQAPEEKLTQLASSDTMSDATLSPMEEAVAKMGSVTVSGAEQTPEEQQYTQQLLEALYPNVAVEGITGAIQTEKEATLEPESIKNIDETGNIFDEAGQVVSSATELGLIKGTDAQGKDVWITNTGDFIPVTGGSPASQAADISSILAPTTPSMGSTTADTFGTGESESAADYPQEIINNPDGSVTIVENDGTQRIFNVDGSVTIIGEDGKASEEYAKPAVPTEAEKAASSGTSTLGNIAGSLLGSVANSAMGQAIGGAAGKIAPWIPGMAAIGAGIGAGIENANSPTTSANQFAYSPYGFNWGQQGVNPANEGIAYGQQFFNPQYTKQAAQGGLMSLPNTVQPTVGPSAPRDPNNSVQMYARGGHLGGYSDGGRMLKGPGDGMSDDIPATIAGRQPARLANEEFVIPADVVSHLGNGSSEAGARVLYEMMDRVRKARTGHTKQGKQINPHQLMPKARK